MATDEEMKEVILTYLKQFGGSMVRVDWLVDQIKAMPPPPLEENHEDVILSFNNAADLERFNTQID